MLVRRCAVVLAAAIFGSGLLALASETGASADLVDAARSDASTIGGGDASDSSARIPPDPPALSEKWQWVFDLRWDKGEVFLLAVRKIDMGNAHPTPRMMGRFALELYEGPTLIERARFDFPMLGAPEAPADAGSGGGGLKPPARFEPKLKTRIGVIFPATKRGTRLELWDRSNDKRWPLPWPPTEGTFGEDAGSKN